MAQLQKTSLQIDPAVLSDMDAWPGLSRSEALRLSIERGHYLSTLKSEEVSGLAYEYAPILQKALAGLGYEHYELAVRSLPEIVVGFLREENRSWRFEGGDQHALEPSELVAKLTKLNPMERMGILDYFVAERLRQSATTPTPPQKGLEGTMPDRIRTLFESDPGVLHYAQVRKLIGAKSDTYIIKMLNDLWREGYLVKPERGYFRKA